MERTTFEQPQYLAFREWYPAFVMAALVLIGLEVGLSETWLRVLP